MMTRPAIRPLLIAAAALLVGATAGCRPHVEVRWAPAAVIVPDDGRWPDAKAVVLLDDTELIDIASHDTSYSEWRIHRVIRLRSRDALELADLRISLKKGREVSAFRARSTAVDGTVRAIDHAALKIAPVEKDEEEEAQVFTASIPGAEVGGLIEYSYVIENDGPLHSWHTDLGRITSIPGLPIVDARMRISVNSIIRYALKVYNSPTRIQAVKDGNMRYLTWRATDLGPPPSEKWAPTDDGWPRIAFKVKAFVFKSWRRAISHTWSDVLKWRTRQIYGDSGELYDDYTAPALPGDCEEQALPVPCRVDAALALAREQAPYDGLANGLSAAEPLADVLAEGAANQYEKAILVGRLLRDAGVEVEYAFGVRSQTGRIDADFPDQGPLNHLLLRVPEQQGMPAAQWLDPGCEHCPRGVLSDWSRGAVMFIVSREEKALGKPIVRARQTLAKGEPAMANRVHNRFTVRLDAEGGAAVELEETYEGIKAATFARAVRRESAEERQKGVESRLAGLDKRARLVEAPEPVCDRAAGRCTRRLSFTIPGYGTPDGREMLVPLSLLRGSGLFSVPGSTRTRDLVIPITQSYDESLTLVPPAGYAFVEGPTAFEAKSDAFETRLAVTTDGALRVERSAERRRGRYAPAAHAARVETLRRAHRVRDTRIRLSKAAP